MIVTLTDCTVCYIHHLVKGEAENYCMIQSVGVEDRSGLIISIVHLRFVGCTLTYRDII